MIRYLLPLLVLLAGCPAHVHRGAWASGQDGQTLNTTQACKWSAKAVRAFDIAAPIAAQLYEEKGYCKDGYEKLVKETRDHLALCLIDQPEPCRPLPWPRHGCADLWTVQQSDKWPPICTPGMPAAFKCVETKAEQRSGWQKNFVHETTNLILQRCGVHDPSYVHEARKLEPEIWRRYQAARGAGP